MMPNGQLGQPMAGQPQVTANPMEETRQKYLRIQQGLKSEIQRYGANDPRGAEAMRKLEQFNQHMANLRSHQVSQRQAAANAAAAQQGQPQSAPAPQPPQTVVQPRPAVAPVGANTSNRPTGAVGPALQTVSAPAPVGGNGAGGQPMKLLVPGHIDPENADNWRREAEARLRTAYASMMQFRSNVQALQGAINNTDKPLPPNELVDKRNQLEQIQKQNKKCEDFINAFRLQQATLARTAASNNSNGSNTNTISAPATSAAANASTGLNFNSHPSTNTVNATSNITNIANSNSHINNSSSHINGSSTSGVDQAPPSSSAADISAVDLSAGATGAATSASNLPKATAPKAQTLQRTLSNIGSVGNALAAVSAQNTASNNNAAQPGSQKSPTSANPLRSTANASAFTPASAMSQISPQAPAGPSLRPSIGGSTISHPQALQQAIHQPAIPESPAKMSAGGPTATPVLQREGASAHRLPIPKTLSMPAPTAVAVPPSRPTLTGGTHTASGPIVGGPAMAKPPQFELDEASGGLLSKRKLHELVRQIDPDESLDPEVEESILELTEDFVDTLLTFACRMAKHRGSDTLDIRDVQMILERNWNIRIPGYSMDDIRTVRKFNPTASYQQKLQALQAGKALNQSEVSKDA
ncbi:hypothetical protein DRE_06320 [Drechslerella stenobrocha 248]|uniref:TBP-associated factor 12 n=1 Tax=Drechslerella stenobrocha 248 TaxID=1043628 RepID=W7I7U7_9PEZI|nr:hypothetical protein DRE_06320 [Drechslerella stenobrocha 248]